MQIFHALAPLPVREIYLRLCEQYNRETDAERRRVLMAQTNTVLEVVRVSWGTVAAGDLMMDADRRLPDDGRPACGGRYIDVAAE